MFNLDEKESNALKEWLAKKDLTKYSGASGGRFTYTFTPTSIGCIVTVIDNLDKNEIDLTNYHDW